MSVGEAQGTVISMLSTGAIVKYRAVKPSATDSENLKCVQAGAGDVCCGVAVETRATAEDTAVQISGLARVQVGAATNDGVLLKADASGKGIDVASNNDDAFALGLTVGGADDDVIWAIILPGAVLSSA